MKLDLHTPQEEGRGQEKKNNLTGVAMPRLEPPYGTKQWGGGREPAAGGEQIKTWTAAMWTAKSWILRYGGGPSVMPGLNKPSVV